MQLAKILNPLRWFRAPVRKQWYSFGQGYRNDIQWFQKGFPIPHNKAPMENSTVLACVKLISEEMARLDINHSLRQDEGGWSNSYQSAPYRVLRNPNHYQTRSDWMLHMMLSLLLEGNAYSVAVRDRRGAVTTLHPVPARGCTPHVVQGDGDVFYHFSSYDVATGDLESGVMVPQRDVLHLRLFCPTHPLIGMSPLVAAYLPMTSHEAINNQTAQFFTNMSRPDGLLTTPKPLPLQAAKRLQDAWKQRAAGGTPILDNDIKYQQLSMTAVDSEIVKLFNLTERQIANAFRVPLEFLNQGEQSTYSNAEQRQKHFISSTLSFYLEHLESAFDKFFDLDPSQKIVFDLESGMMRPDFKERMDALSKGVTGGVLTPNEAREKENRPPVEGGNQVYMQRQNWPLDLLGDDANSDGTPSSSTTDNPNDADEQDTSGNTPDNPNDADEPDKGMTVVEIREYVRQREEQAA